VCVGMALGLSLVLDERRASDAQFRHRRKPRQQKLEVALGLYIGDSDEVLLNPARDEEWQPAANDQVVVLAQQVYQ
jgi:hypothetical protein